MTEEAVSAAAEAVAAEVSAADQEKCTRQLAQIVPRKLKYRLRLQATDLYIAGNATRNINRRDIENILN